MKYFQADKIQNMISQWFETIVIDLFRQMRWSFLPPILVYLAAGLSGITGIVGIFFVKDYLGLSAAFLASLTFWAGIPWALKMPIGHLVDLLWKWKAPIIFLGAGLVGLSLIIMYGLIAHTAEMQTILPLSTWYIIATLLSPVGYVIQDTVADAMTVEAISPVDKEGKPLSEDTLKAMHTTMQTLGRFSIIGGLVLIYSLNIFMFSGIEAMTKDQKAEIYATLYLVALFIPFISVLGVVMNMIITNIREKKYRELGFDEERIKELLGNSEETTTPNWWILGGGLAFVVFTLTVGLTNIPFSHEIVFIGSMAIVIFLIRQMLVHLTKAQARVLIGTAIIIFMFRAVPLPGPGITWFEIDILKFDQQFISVLALISALLTLIGMVVLRPLMATKSIAYIVILLTLVSGVLMLPNIGLYYGLHHWTSEMTNGVVDARFIAIIDTAIESPLGQIAMIPMLAWIAKNAPEHLKATFFAVMASFTNLALSAASLGTKYINQIFVVKREVKDPVTAVVKSTADYSQLGILLIVVTFIAVIIPLATIYIIQRSSLKTNE